MKKLVTCFTLCAILLSSLAACGKADSSLQMMKDNDKAPQMLSDFHGTTYEIYVGSFYDASGDGMGDLKGVLEKLDYINDGNDKTDSDLGCDSLWLMPVMPSPTYHKYDVTDFFNIDPAYGTLEDFKDLSKTMHERGMKLLFDLPLNHTSSKHPWFITACEYLKNLPEGATPSAAECPEFGYYYFTDSKVHPDYYYSVPGTDWFYEGKFWSEMPDLNLENDELFKEIEKILTFWQENGVDGFRLDAVKEFISDNTEKNVAILKRIKDIVYANNPDAYIVGEAWTAYSTFSRYYKSEVPSFFNFAFGTRDGYIAKTLNGATNSGAASFGIMIEKVNDAIKANTDDYIDAPFYTNHDTPRSYTYYKGDNITEKVKMAEGMNLLMSGNAFLYYGEEFGMKSGGIDEEKRMPMPWGGSYGKDGVCYPPTGAGTVELPLGTYADQKDDPYSVYNFVKQVIKIRNANPEIARGVTANVAELSDKNISALKKTYNDSTLYIIYNLSNEEQVLVLNEKAPDLDIKEKCGSLQTGEAPVIYKSGTLTLPPYSAAILK